MHRQNKNEPAHSYLTALVALAEGRVAPEALISAVRAYQAGQSDCILAWLIDQQHLSQADEAQISKAVANRIAAAFPIQDQSSDWELPRKIPIYEELVSGKSLSSLGATAPSSPSETTRFKSRPMGTNEPDTKTRSQSLTSQKSQFGDDASYEEISEHLEAEVMQPHHRLDLLLQRVSFGYVTLNHVMVVLLVLLCVGLIWFLFFI